MTLTTEFTPGTDTNMTTESSQTEAAMQPVVGVGMVDILVPPFGLIFLLLLGMFVLMFNACWKRRKLDQTPTGEFGNKVGPILNGSTFDINITLDHPANDGVSFLTSSDIEAMKTLKRHYNRPCALVALNMPAVISLALCPFLLLISMPLRMSFWPQGMPNINDAVSCFLAPAGLVYAVTFGFTFQSVLDKQLSISNTVATEVGMLDQILLMTSMMTPLTNSDRLKIYTLIKKEIISIMQQVTGLRGMSSKDFQHEYSQGQAWGIINIMQADGKQMENCDAVMMDKMISNLQELSQCSTQRHMTLHYKVHPLLWMFLEMLGFFSFFGVMLIKTQSSQMDLMMCIITVFSISLLCYVVGDLDNPFSGFFRVNLSSLWHLVGKTDHFYHKELGRDGKALRVTSIESLQPWQSGK